MVRGQKSIRRSRPYSAVNRRIFLTAAGSTVLTGASGCVGLTSRGVGSDRDHGSDGDHEEHHDEADEDHGDDSHHHDLEPIDRPVSHADVAMVTENGHHFEPHLVWIELGGTVSWTTESGVHTTTAYHADGETGRWRIPEDASGWDSDPREVGESFERTFDVGGVYDYLCSPHEDAGMVGSVIAGEPDPHSQPGLEPPGEEIPAEARSVLEEMNHAANETLGHTHD